MFLLPLLAACQPVSVAPMSPPYALGDVEELPAADAVAAADLDGDGVDEVIWVREGVARWSGGEQDLGGRVQVVDRGDVDGDGREEALIATGVGRGVRDVPARLWAIGADGGRVLWEQSGARPQVVDLHVVPQTGGDRLFLVAFEDERMVAGGWVQDGALDVVERTNLSLAMVPLQDGVMVSRLYGDEPKTPGDAVFVGSDGTRRTLPTHRGVRAAEALDVDGDGRPELFLADGWHHAYGEHADPTVVMVPGDPALPGRTVARLDGSYAVMAIEALPDGALLLRGSRQVAILQRDALGWAVLPLVDASETDQAVFAKLAEGPAVLVSGTPARQVRLQHR